MASRTPFPYRTGRQDTGQDRTFVYENKTERGRIRSSRHRVWTRRAGEGGTVVPTVPGLLRTPLPCLFHTAAAFRLHA